ncbi:hypothetical protein DPEC_G00207550 [Dallia pectoralis]|uniref:Uncharacterized protein n=1 Tax=Dallia pectoralis TaxID=75939 RepID=A0ACC2G532_DALPE|nr:hypothetical protein DPEC_G00207550 [Dallia pectoralis]
MNELHSQYSDMGLVVLGVPCNQFGHQENCQNDEILRSLKYVRPGNGFEPKFPLLQKVDVNGIDAHPLFVYLKEKLPFPSDDSMSFMSDPKFIMWSPVCRNDISWNFEKFLTEGSRRNLHQTAEVLSKTLVLKMSGQDDPVQREIHQDWANREYIEVITSSIKKIADFLNSFDMSCRSRLATLNEKLTALERRIEYIEARVTKGETLT